MSFILDALKKSENERQRQSGPTLYEVRVARPAARFPIWAIALGALLGLNVVGFVAWAMLRGSGAPSAETAATTASTQTMAANTPAAPSGTAAPPAQIAMPPGAPLPSPGAPNTATAFNPPLIEDPSLAADEIPALPQSASPNGNQYQNTPRSSEPRPGLPSRDDLANAGGSGSGIPPVALSLHVYDPSPTRRFVIINGQRAREGEQLPSGLRVEEISPQGAVMSWQGSKFLVTVQ